MNHRAAIGTAIAAVLALLTPATARAGQVLSLNTDAKGGVDRLATVTFTYDNAVETGLAGTFTTKARGGSGIDTYCIDLLDTTYVGNGGSTWDAEILPISSFANYPDGSNWAEVGGLYGQYAPTVSGRIDGAGLQMAIWKAEYDGTSDFSKGNLVFADSADPSSDQHLVYASATRYLAGYDPARAGGDETFLRATSHPGALYQDLIGPGGPNFQAVVPTPEPSAIVLAASGLAALLIARARRCLRRR